MKKKLSVFSLLVALVFLFAACKPKIPSDTVKPLAAPADLVYADGEVTFSAVENATGYLAEVNGNERALENKTSVVLEGYGDFAVRVKALGDNTKYSDSAWSEILNVTKSAPAALPAPQNLRYEDGAVKWNAVPNAASYTVTVNGTAYTTADNYLVYDGLGILNVKVIAKGDGALHFDSAPAGAEIFATARLSAPARVRYDSAAHTVRWDRVEYAIGYQVKIGEQSFAVSAEENCCEITNSGDFTVSVTAVGAGRYVSSEEAILSVKAQQSVIEVATEEELRAVTAGNSYRLSADIALAQNWVPVDFWGELDGNGKTISGVAIESSASEIGLFSVLLDAHIYDLTLDGVTIAAQSTGAGYVGALAGRTENTRIERVTIRNAVIEANAAVVGGLIGCVSDGPAADISDCIASVSVTLTGGGSAGGLLGEARSNELTVSRCGALGTISGGLYTGGFVGRVAYGIFNDCYARVGVTSAGTAAGGFVGLLEGRNVKVLRAYCAGTVEGGNDAGAFAGVVPTGGFTGGNIFANCFYDSAVCSLNRIGNASVGNGNGITASAALKNGLLPAGFSASVWSVSAGEYPELIGA